MGQEKKFSGTFRIRDIIRREDRCGKPYSQLHVSGDEGLLRILAWDGRYSGPRELHPGMIVNITGSRFADSGRRRCETVLVLSDPVAERLYRDAACRLRMMEQSLADPTLNNFLRHLLVDDPRGQRFLTDPASQHHHHSYRHGLFVHSVDVALRLFGDPTIGRADKPLAVMLGLSHDVGKLWWPVDGFMAAGQHHDKFTIAVLNTTIERLSDRWPKRVADLTQVLCLRQDRTRTPGLPRRIDLLQEALGNADRVSCAESWGSGASEVPVEVEDPFTATA